MPSGAKHWPRAPWSMAIVGCGLIGGSIALAAQRRWPKLRIIAVDRPAVVRRARAAGLAHAGANPHKITALLARERPRLVVLAAPIDANASLLPALAEAIEPLATADRPLILDVGSVKAPIVAQAEALGLPRFIGGHPMAGLETPGLSGASAALLQGVSFALCRPNTTEPADLQWADAFVRGLGCRPRPMEAHTHDDCVALTSHLPHLLATMLMHLGAEAGSDRELRELRELPWTLAAGSWRDATRVAAADPQQWETIFAHNRGPLLQALHRLLSLGQQVATALQTPQPQLTRAGIDAAALARLRRRLERFLPQSPEPDLHKR